MMSPVHLLFDFNIVLAILVFSVVAIAEPFIEKWLHDLLEDNPPFCIAWDLFFAPFLRAVAVVLFIYLAYPALFALNTAPGISELMHYEDAKTGNLLGVMFLIGLLLPLIPALNRHPEFVLPIQGAIATAYVFTWLAHYLHITTASVWPGIEILLIMVLLSYLGHRIAGWCGQHLGHQLDQRFSTHGLDNVTRYIIELLVQIPVILTYGYGLGYQLSM